MSRGQPSAVRLFRELFAAHPAHVAMLDTEGVILAVNHAWTKFGRANGLADDYRFEKQDYLEVCQRAATERSPLAQEAMLGLAGVLKAGRNAYSLVYPCHAPTEDRWFRMWVQSQQPEVSAVVVAHSYVGRERPVADHKRSAVRRTLCPGVDNIITTTQQAGRSLRSGRPEDPAVAYPRLYIGLFAGAGAGVVPLSR